MNADAITRRRLTSAAVFRAPAKSGFDTVSPEETPVVALGL